MQFLVNKTNVHGNIDVYVYGKILPRLHKTTGIFLEGIFQSRGLARSSLDPSVYMVAELKYFHSRFR